MVLDEKLLSILICPADRGPLLYVHDERLRERHQSDAVLYNPRLHRVYRIDDEIPVLLIDEARDVSDDEHALLIALASPEDRR